MSTISTAVHDMWHIAGWTMLHYFWIGACIGCVALTLKRLLAPADSQVRYLIALGSLVLLAVIPAGVAVHLVADATGNPQTASISGGAAVAERTSAADGLANGMPGYSLSTGAMTGKSDPTMSRSGTSAATAVVRMVVEHLPWFWLFGAPLTFSLVVTGLVGAERIRRHGHAPGDGAFADQIRLLSRAIGVSRAVGVVFCDRIASPILIGILRPAIVLPTAAASGWTSEQIEMVLLHELAHVRRWDNLVNLLQRCIESLLFFQPAVWIVSGWVRQEREHCCDDFVISYTGRAHAYAETLVALATQQTATSRSAPGLRIAISAMAENDLLSRIRRILNIESDRLQVSPKTLASVLSVCLLLLVSVTWWSRQRLQAGAAEGLESVQPLTTQQLASIEEKSRGNPLNPSHTRISGVVVDDRGNPSADVTLTAMDWKGELVRSMSDADGIFLLELESPLVAVLNAEDRVAGINLVPGNVSRAGKRSSVNLGASQIAYAETDAQGIATFDWLPTDGEHVGFMPQSTAYYCPEWTVDNAMNGSADLTMKLFHNVRLTGKVVHSDGNPAAGIMIQAEDYGATTRAPVPMGPMQWMSFQAIHTLLECSTTSGRQRVSQKSKSRRINQLADSTCNLKKGPSSTEN